MLTTLFRVFLSIVSSGVSLTNKTNFSLVTLLKILNVEAPYFNIDTVINFRFK